jgi:hypothetical protein
MNIRILLGFAIDWKFVLKDAASEKIGAIKTGANSQHPRYLELYSLLLCSKKAFYGSINNGNGDN